MRNKKKFTIIYRYASQLAVWDCIAYTESEAKRRLNLALPRAKVVEVRQ